jgi:cyanophycinase
MHKYVYAFLACFSFLLAGFSPVNAAQTEFLIDDFDDRNLREWDEFNEYDWHTQPEEENDVPGHHPSNNRVANANNCDRGCILQIEDPIDLSTFTSAELSFWRYIDTALDRNEYLRVEIYNGSTWDEIAYWQGRVDDDDTWYHEKFPLGEQYLINDFNVRFTAKMSRSNEDVEIDDVLIVAESVPVFQPPVANAGVDITAIDSDGTDDQAVVLDGSMSTDSDGTISEYRWGKAGMQIASGATPEVMLEVGTHVIELTVIDNDGLTATDIITVVIGSNMTPTANAGVDQNLSDADGSEGEMVMLSGFGSDQDGEIVLYQWFENSVLLASGALAEVELGTGKHDIMLVVTDNGGATAFDTVTITVEPNLLPTASAGIDLFMQDGDGDGFEDVVVTGAGADLDGTITTLEWIVAGEVVATGAETTLNMPLGENQVELRVTDNGGATATDSLLITVEPNLPPIAIAAGETTATDDDGDGTAGVNVSAVGSSDNDGTIVAYEWSVNGTTVGVGIESTITLPIGASQVLLTVTDNGGATATDTILVSVESNLPPVANAGSNIDVIDANGDGTENVQLSAVLSTDSDGSVVQYVWSKDGIFVGEGVSISVDVSIGEHSFDLTVTDNGGRTAIDSVLVNVSEPTDYVDPYPSNIVDTSGLSATRFGTIAFDTKDGNRLTAYTYRATQFDSQDGPILFIMHGAGRTAESYLQSAAAVAERYNALAIAVEFPKSLYPSSSSYTMGVYDQNGDFLSTDDYLYSEIEHLFEAVKIHFNGTQEGYYIYGLSAGGQFTHRLVTFLPQARVLGAVSASPGWYTLPSDEASENTEMPYGLYQSPMQGSDLSKLFAAPLTVLGGEFDTLTPDQDSNLRSTPEAMVQGEERLARAQYYIDFAEQTANTLGHSFDWRFGIVPRAEHSSSDMIDSAGFFLFNPKASACETSAATAAENLVITEVLADPPSDEVLGDANGDGFRSGGYDEFIEMVNTGDEPVCLDGWTIGDVSRDVRHTFPLGSELNPGKAIVVFGGGIPTGDFGGAIVQRAVDGSVSFSNSGDIITIRDADGVIAKQLSWGSCGGETCVDDDIYGSLSIDQSITRSLDVSGGWAKHTFVSSELFSPGTKNDGTPYSIDDIPDGNPFVEQVLNTPRKLLIVGGNTPLESNNPIVQKMAELAGGANGKLAVIPTAYGDAGDLQAWLDAGVGEVINFHAADRTEADSPAFYGQLDDVTAVWIEGGSQTDLMERYVGTATEQALHSLLERGGTVGGTSAGAAIQSRLMRRTSSSGVPVEGIGFDFLFGSYVDQHFWQRSRQDLLIQMLENNPGYLAIGIDENTGLLVEGRTLTAINTPSQSGHHSVNVYLSSQTNPMQPDYEMQNGDTLDLIDLLNQVEALQAQ